MKRWWMVPLAALLFTARPAGAQSVGVLPYAAAESPVTSARLGEALGEAGARLGLSPELRPFDRARKQLGAGAVPREALEPFGRARQLLAEGWRSYLEVRPTFAAGRLAEARQRAAEVAPLQDGLRLLAEISLRLGAVKLALGRDREAARDFQLASALAPEREVTDAEFKPRVVAAYEAAVREGRPSIRREVRVRPERARAQVQVDGRGVGRAPAAVELEEGLHVLVVRAPGYRPLSQVFAAERPEPLEVTLERSPLEAAVRRGNRALPIGTGERAAAIALEALSLYGELEAVLLAATVWRRGQPALLGQWCAGGPSRCGRVVEVGYTEGGQPAAVAELWRRARREGRERRFPPTLLADARLTEPEPAPGRGGEPKRDEGRWWENPWLWVGVSGTVLSAAAAAILIGEREVRPAIDVNPDEF